MLIMAKARGLSSLATDLTALLEERDSLYKKAGADINIRINLLRAFRRGDYVDMRFKQIERVAAQYRKVLSCDIDNSLVNPDETGLLVAYAFPEQIAQEIPSAIAQFKLANGIIAAVTEGDSLSQNRWLAVANIFAGDSVGRIFLASSLNPDDITPFLENYEYVIWNTKKGGINAYKESRVGNIVLQRKPLKNYDVQLRVDAICKALVKEGEQLLNFSSDVIQLQNRITSLRIWNDDKRWPDMSTSKLLSTTDTWLALYLRGVKKPEDLKKIDVRKILYFNLPVYLQKELDNLAPERILVPSGSKIKLHYNPDSSPPVLAVRLQELFGLEQTPTINGDKNRVLMHILSPGFKLVQVTNDLLSFWNNAYFDVRKELRKRYPKHEWPESPKIAMPICGVKRRGNN
jgi:ATP-dependent helicase HrpB